MEVTPMRRTGSLVAFLVLLVLGGAAPAGDTPAPAPPAGTKENTPPAGTEPAMASSLPKEARTIRLTGRLPFFEPGDETDAELSIEFALYTSPSGGVPFWRETRKVLVRKGEVELRLGEATPLPDAAFTETFRYVGLRFEGEAELSPRFPVECCLWAHGDGDYAAPSPAPPARTTPGPLVPLGPEARAAVEATPRPAATWVEAALAAAREGRRLPTAEEWAAAAAAGEAGGFHGITGHYEWVAPFVYSAQGHLRELLIYRGKPNGCSEEELSPSMNAFPYRLAADLAVKGRQ
jgi:hypothetical protein